MTDMLLEENCYVGKKSNFDVIFVIGCNAFTMSDSNR